MSTKEQKYYKTINKIFKNIFISLFTLLLIPLIGLVYFLTIISIENKSFSFIHNKIEKTLNKNIENYGKIEIENSYLGIDDFYKLNIVLENVNIELKNDNIYVNNLDIEFSLFNLIFNRLIPTKIAVVDSNIEFNHKEELINNDKTIDSRIIFHKVWNILTLINDSKSNIKHIDLENININIALNNKNTYFIESLNSEFHIKKEKNELIFYYQTLLI